MLTTALCLRDLGHDVVVAGPRGCMLVQKARLAGLEVFDDLELKSGFRPVSFLRDVWALRVHFSKKSYDILDTHGSQDTWRSMLAVLTLSKRPVFVRSRHNIFPVRGHVFNRWLYRHVDHVITISPQIIPCLEHLVSPDRCTSVYSAPDASRFNIPQEPQAVRKELGLPDQAKIVGVVGRLAPEKGHTYLIAAAPRILERVPDAHFVFVGTGRSKGDLERQVSDLGLRDKFTFVGFREDVPRVLQAFDLFVLCPIEGEGLGTSILEAFLAGKPVVATDLGGIIESVKHKITGLLVPPGDAASLATACVEMLENPAMAQQMAARGKELIQRQFTPEDIARLTAEVYLQGLARRSPG